MESPISKKRVLVLYYTQSGQLRNIIDNILKDIIDEVDVVFEQLKPVTPFELPWKVHDFFDTMPETVAHIPVPMMPLSDEVKDTRFDVVILGYQPWFLNPSLPVSSFLQSEEAKTVLAGKPVITVIGCRNMWLHGQERVKEYLLTAGAKLVGNIVLKDCNPNLTSTLTVIRWSFKGQKEASRFLPEAGVQKKDIKNAQRFGPIILNPILSSDYRSLQATLLANGAIDLNPSLILLEQNGIKNFRKWSGYILRKGPKGNDARMPIVRLFKNLLIVGIFILSPVSSLLAAAKKRLQRNKLLVQMGYFLDVKYSPQQI